MLTESIKYVEPTEYKSWILELTKYLIFIVLKFNKEIVFVEVRKCWNSCKTKFQQNESNVELVWEKSCTNKRTNVSLKNSKKLIY